MKIISAFGDDIRPYVDALARLRMQIFREFPYLYNGHLDYEHRYLADYAGNPDNLCLFMVDSQNNPRSSQDNIVGAATAMWLKNTEMGIHRDFKHFDWPIADIFYFGEILLLPAYRHRGFGRLLMNALEAQALQAGAKITSFFTIVRPDHHPERPKNYFDSGLFWHQLGYRCYPNLNAYVSYQEIGQTQETEQVMPFWLKFWDPQVINQFCLK